MQIIEKSITEITPYEKNPRKNDEAVEYVANSIKEFGFKVPIVIDKDGVIVAGHTRYKAAQELGLEKLPCVIADDLTEEQVKAFRLADNKVGELAEWDFDLLGEELDGIFDIDMSEFGFELNLDDNEPQEIEEDEIPEEVETRCKLGNIWQLGEHFLICGDSTDPAVIDRLMDGVKADMVFTDPPYNIASDSKNVTKDSNSPRMRELAKTEWDKDFVISDIFESILQTIKNDCTVYICTSHFLAGEIWTWMKTWADHFSYCIWSKPNPMPSLMKRHWTWNTEIVCYATRGKHTFNFPKEGHALSTWTINKINGKTGHPTEKPVEVPAMAISHSSKENSVVLDLFGGSGSTLIACEQLNRKCYMCELDEHYCDVIISRYENFTGKAAVKVN